MKPDNEANHIVDWMKQFGNDPSLRSQPVRDPDLLWMKAKILDRQAAQERALKPVEWFATVARILVGFAACLLAWTWTRSMATPAAAVISPAMLSLGIAVVLSAIVMAVYPLWASE